MRLVTMTAQSAVTWTTIICIFAVIGAVTDGRETSAVAGSSSPDAQAIASNTIVYCQPLPTMAAVPSGGSEHHVGNGRKTATAKTGKGYAGKVQQHDYASDGNENGHAYEKDGKYWLVPPFLIGASSIVVIYVFVHCMYTHCSCSDDKRRRRRPGGPVPIRRVQITTASGMTTASVGGNGRGPTIVLSDSAGGNGGAGGSATAASGSRLVPLVCYDEAGTAAGSGAAAGGGMGSAYGRTQLVEAQPFLIYEQCDDSLDYYEEQPPTPRKGSGFLQLPAAIGRRLSQARLSFSSIGRGSHGRDREPRASLCFLPVARTISDPSGVPGDGVANGSIVGGMGGGTGQVRFETFYCRSCGSHNVVDVGTSASASAVVTSTAKPTSPDGDAMGVDDGKQETDCVGCSSPPPIHSTGAAFPVPTILVDDEDMTAENNADCIASVGADDSFENRDTAVVIVADDS